MLQQNIGSAHPSMHQVLQRMFEREIHYKLKNIYMGMIA